MIFSFESIYVKKRKIIDSATFCLPEKGFFLIQGPNGSGKTLLLNDLFQRKMEENTGCVLIDQSNNRILPKENVLANIAFDKSDIRKAQINAFLREEGLLLLAEHPARHLSGGEKRTVALLRGLTRKTDIYFIDEPTNDLDQESVERLLTLLQQKASESLILAVSHDDRLEKVCSGKLTIKDGRLRSDTVPIKDVFCPLDMDEKAEQNISVRNPFLRKQFSFRWVSFLLLLAELFVLISAELAISMQYQNSIPDMQKDRIDFYVPISSYFRGYEEGAFPASLLSYLRGESSLKKFVEDYINCRNAAEYGMTLNLNLPYGSDYRLFKVEYYNVRTHSSFDVWEEYLLCKGINVDMLPDNTEKQWEWEEFDTNNVEDYTLFCSIADELEESDSDWKLVFCVVDIKKENGLIDFLFSDDVSALMGGQYYVRSNDTITLTNNVNIVIAEKGFLILLLAVMFAGSVLETIFQLLYVYRNRITIRIFRNMATPLESQKREIYRKSGDLILKSSSIFVAFLLSVFIFVKLVCKPLADSVGYFALFGLFLLQNCFICFTNHLLINKRIAHINEWRYRC